MAGPHLSSKKILANYIVVFVGYSADDPPVQYLLEALNIHGNLNNKLYAFQSGDQDNAADLWRYKGVEAIAYSAENNYQALWDSLEAWAFRARDLDGWYRSVMELAVQSPEHLKPHERGQVAHLVKNVEGARIFMEHDPSPPGTWLCVFDPSIRYAKPGKTGGVYGEGPFVDPFYYFGLDSDEPPEKPENIDPDYLRPEREVPKDAWSALETDRLDRERIFNTPVRQDGIEQHLSAFEGYAAVKAPSLPKRLEQLRHWIGKICDQPAVVWWAAAKYSLHPDIQHSIKRAFDKNKQMPEVVYKAWQLILQAGTNNWHDTRIRGYMLLDEINNFGWNNQAVREFGLAHRSYLMTRRNNYYGPLPPEVHEELTLSHILKSKVEYPSTDRGVDIPVEWLPLVLRELRTNLEIAQELEIESGGYHLESLRPIRPDSRSGGHPTGRDKSLYGHLVTFAGYFEKLADCDRSAAIQEFLAWPNKNDVVFTRLRIWACGISDLVSAEKAGEIILGLDDDSFWNTYHTREYLTVLTLRWDGLSPGTKKRIENRILAGPVKHEIETENGFDDYQVRAVLHRLQILYSKGCEFTFDYKAESERLQGLLPDRAEKHDETESGVLEQSDGWVGKDTDYSALMDVPIELVLTKAKEIREAQKFTENKDPFAGLAEEKPERALTALSQAADEDQYPEWEWRAFLSSEARLKDEPQFMCRIAERLHRCPNHQMKPIVMPVSDWVKRTIETLSSKCPLSIDRILNKLITVFENHPDVAKSNIRTRDLVDWISEAINAPAGIIAQALMKDTRIPQKQEQSGIPDGWLSNAERLLALKVECNRYPLVIFARHLAWFYFHTPKWTETHLLSVLGSPANNRDAFWHGFLQGSRQITLDLFKRIKPDLMALPGEKSFWRSGYSDGQAGLILNGWLSQDGDKQSTLISSREYREVLFRGSERFRLATLRVIRNSLSKEQDGVDLDFEAKTVLFFRKVWPRQKTVKSPKISKKIFEILFLVGDSFLELSDLFLPLLGPIDDLYIDLPRTKDDAVGTVDLHPQQMLGILDKVLPRDVRNWPYNIEEYLHRIGEANAKLKTDLRLIELKRKWNSR